MRSRKSNLNRSGVKRKSLNLIFILILVSLIIVLYFQKKKDLNNLFQTYFVFHEIYNPYLSNQRQEIIELLGRYEIYAVSIKPQPDGIAVKLGNGTQIYFPKENLETKVASLQLLLKRFTIEGRKIKVIDLRYSKPIIK